MSTPKSESAFNLFTRLRKSESTIDEILLKNKTVTLIDISKGDLISANHVVYRVTKSCLLESINKKHDDSEEKVIVNKSDEPSIIIFDDMNAFSMMKFSMILTKIELLQNINIYQTHEHHGLLALLKHIKTHLAFNNNLKLIVIYASSNVDDILKLISKCPLKVTVIVVANSISKQQSNDCLSKPSYQLLDCRTAGIGLVVLKTHSYDMFGSIKPKIGLTFEKTQS